MQLNLGADLCTVRAGAGRGGSISPAGRVCITCGDGKTFAITPDDGYIVADVLVDDVSVGAKRFYTFTSVTADHGLVARFAPAC